MCLLLTSIILHILLAAMHSPRGALPMAETRLLPTPLPSAKRGRRREGAPCAAEYHADYLAVLGERVRAARVRRGMTRKILAHDSGVSERYLAQLEAGQGNISIALLRHT